jgi:hypothetical protein
MFISGSLMIIICSAIWSAKTEQDWFNPLTLLIVISLVRYTVPWVLLATAEPPHLFLAMRLTSAHWQSGHSLALLGMLAVILGWYITPTGIADSVQRCLEFLSYRTTSQLGITWAWFTFVLGLVGLAIFVVSNHGDILAVASSGAFRRTAVQEGTGVFFYLAIASIAGSTLLTSYLLMKYRCISVVTMLPAVVNGLAFFILGGRARSFTPMACVLLIGWYVILNRQLNRKWLLRVTALVLLLITFSYAGQTYRGKGLAALGNVFSLSNVIAYTQYAVWIEFGQLHALAGVMKVEPGALAGKSFVSALGIIRLWLGLQSQNSGVLIAQKVWSNDKTKWGYHASFIGDSYLNYGFPGVVLLGMVFGSVLRSTYRVGVRMLGNPIGLTFCAIMMVYSLRIFFEAIDKTLEMQTVLFSLVSGPLLMRFFRGYPTGERQNLSTWTPKSA